MTQQAVLVKRARIYLEELKAPARPVPADAHDVQAVRWKMREQLEQAAFTAFRTALEDGGYEGEHVGLEGIEYLAVSSHNERFTGDGLNMNRFERYLYKRKADKEKPPVWLKRLFRSSSMPEEPIRSWRRSKVRTSRSGNGLFKTSALFS